MSDHYDMSEFLDGFERSVAGLDDVVAVRAAWDQLAKLDGDLVENGRPGRARVAAAMRRVEMRLGELMPRMTAAQAGSLAGSGGAPPSPVPVSRKQASQFRTLRDHRDLVETIIAESTDVDPPTRRKILRRIAEANGKPAAPESPRSTANVRAREATVRDMAERGYTRSQIAEAIGVGSEQVGVIAKRIGVEVHADKVAGKRRRIDANRIVGEAVPTLEGVVMALDLVDVGELDAADLTHWTDSLGESVRALSRFHRRLKEVVSNVTDTE